MIRRRLLRALLACALLLAGAALAGILWLRASLPGRDGERRIAGLAQPVLIRTDAHGIPHLHAQSLSDAAFALGYVHAQDRFFQMELARRFVNGRLAELLGASVLELDRRSLRLGFADDLAAELEALSDDERQLLQIYADGVNAELRNEGAPWALRLLRVKPRPWTPSDSAALALYMDDRLSEDGDEELRVSTAARVGRRVANWLRTVEPQDSPAIAVRPAAPPALPKQVGAASPSRLLESSAPPARRALPADRQPAPEAEPARGSNAWAVDGRWSRGGRPLLCNDTHLQHAVPALFYLVTITLPSGTLAGFSIPGAPLVVIGTNGALAWGVTTLYDDAIDFVQEHFAGSDSTRVLRPGGSEAVTEHVELVPVRGRAHPDTLRFRRTSHGPLVTLAGRPGLYARRWVRDCGGGSLGAMLRLQQAGSLEQAQQALSTYPGPGQNFVLADTVGAFGRVGWVPAGLWPLRTPADDGSWPLDGAQQPAGPPPLAPFAQRPVLLPSPDGAAITANHRVAFGDDGLRLAAFWPMPWRAERIEERLGSARPLDVPAMASIQLDAVAIPARRLAALLARTPPPPAAPADVQSWWARLAQWDGAMSADERPTLYRALIDRLGEEIFADDWPEAVAETPPQQWGRARGGIPLERAVWRALGVLGETPLAAPDDSLDARDWIDDHRTAELESPADILARALDWALRAVRARYGADPRAWRWDHVHTVTLAHPLARVPLMARWLTLGPVAVAGDRDTPCANATSGRPDLKVETIPVMRMVVDLGDLQRTRCVLSTGQSEHPLSRWFRDQFALWSRGATIPLFENEGDVASGVSGAAAYQRLRLLPRGGSGGADGGPTAATQEGAR